MAPDGIGGKPTEAVERDDVAGEQRRGVHVVLQEFGADHGIADLDLVAQASRDAGEEDSVHPMAFNQQGGGAGGGDFADAREDGHEVLAMPMPGPELAPPTAVGRSAGLGQHAI